MNTFHFRLKNISSKYNRKPWITPGILISIRVKQRLEKKARNRPDQFLTNCTDVSETSSLTKLTQTTSGQHYRNLLESP